MMILLVMIILQLFIAAIVLFVLLRLLDRELQRASLEKFAAWEIPANCSIQVYSAKPLSSMMKEELNAVVQRKSKEHRIEFRELKDLRGGIVIKAADNVLDFSVSSRLENFWS